MPGSSLLGGWGECLGLRCALLGIPDRVIRGAMRNCPEEQVRPLEWHSVGCLFVPSCIVLRHSTSACSNTRARRVQWALSRQFTMRAIRGRRVDCGRALQGHSTPSHNPNCSL